MKERLHTFSIFLDQAWKRLSFGFKIGRYTVSDCRSKADWCSNRTQKEFLPVNFLKFGVKVLASSNNADTHLCAKLQAHTPSMRTTSLQTFIFLRCGTLNLNPALSLHINYCKTFFLADSPFSNAALLIIPCWLRSVCRLLMFSSLSKRERENSVVWVG